LLQKDLLAAMQDSRKCKLEINERFQDRLFAPKASGTPPLISAEIEKLRAQALHYAAKAQGGLGPAASSLERTPLKSLTDTLVCDPGDHDMRLDKLTAKFQNALADDLLVAAGVDAKGLRSRASKGVRVGQSPLIVLYRLLFRPAPSGLTDFASQHRLNLFLEAINAHPLPSGGTPRLSVVSPSAVTFRGG
jgi:hypothetical protein